MREVVLDIETTPCPEAEWNALLEKAPSLQKKERTESALDWSVGRIVCIGLIVLDAHQEQEHCFAGSDEASVLRDFWGAIRPNDRLVGHNLIAFDLPYIQARSVVNQIKPSRSLDLRRYSTAAVYDTMQVWANWDRPRFPKLELLAAVLGLDSKTGSGDQVAIWVEANDWDRVRDYCMQDVRLTRDIYRRMKQYGL
jgi:hypothetical protein